MRNFDLGIQGAIPLVALSYLLQLVDDLHDLLHVGILVLLLSVLRLLGFRNLVPLFIRNRRVLSTLLRLGNAFILRLRVSSFHSSYSRRLEIIELILPVKVITLNHLPHLLIWRDLLLAFIVLDDELHIFLLNLVSVVYDIGACLALGLIG